jgi:hypothetical protein
MPFSYEKWPDFDVGGSDLLGDMVADRLTLHDQPFHYGHV